MDTNNAPSHNAQDTTTVSRRTLLQGAALLATGESPRHPDLDPIEHATWTVVCNTLLNLDEALTRE